MNTNSSMTSRPSTQTSVPSSATSFTYYATSPQPYNQQASTPSPRASPQALSSEPMMFHFSPPEPDAPPVPQPAAPQRRLGEAAAQRVSTASQLLRGATGASTSPASDADFLSRVPASRSAGFPYETASPVSPTPMSRRFGAINVHTTAHVGASHQGLQSLMSQNAAPLATPPMPSALLSAFSCASTDSQDSVFDTSTDSSHFAEPLMRWSSSPHNFAMGRWLETETRMPSRRPSTPRPPSDAMLISGAATRRGSDEHGQADKRQRRG